MGAGVIEAHAVANFTAEFGAALGRNALRHRDGGHAARLCACHFTQPRLLQVLWYLVAFSARPWT